MPPFDRRRRIKQLEIEAVALKKEKDAASKERLKAVNEELANLQEQRDRLRAKWLAEKEAIQKIREVKAQIDQLKIEMEQAERYDKIIINDDLERAVREAEEYLGLDR